MAICKWCKKEMMDPKVVTCKANKKIEFTDEVTLKATTFHFGESTGRCSDCNIKHGGNHHPGCDIERCPKCGGQLISCDCTIKKQLIFKKG